MRDTGRTRTAVSALCRRAPCLSVTVSGAPGRPLTPGVRLELRDERVAEHADGDLERVELVERVLPPVPRVEVELEPDRVVAVCDLERHPWLEVRRAARAGRGAE